MCVVRTVMGARGGIAVDVARLLSELTNTCNDSDLQLTAMRTGVSVLTGLRITSVGFAPLRSATWGAATAIIPHGSCGASHPLGILIWQGLGLKFRAIFERVNSYQIAVFYVGHVRSVLPRAYLPTRRGTIAFAASNVVSEALRRPTCVEIRRPADARDYLPSNPPETRCGSRPPETISPT